MSVTFIHNIKQDLQESKITWKVVVLFIPIAFFTFLFHESGHWVFGELTGNDMVLSLNNASPKNGYFIHESDALWSAIGGPVFTIIQAIIFLILMVLTRSIYTYAFIFFAFFSRFFSIVFGGIELQDEARIASFLGVNTYLVAALVLSVLLLLLWKANRIMNFKLKTLGYYTVLGVVAILIVISTNAILN